MWNLDHHAVEIPPHHYQPARNDVLQHPDKIDNIGFCFVSRFFAFTTMAIFCRGFAYSVYLFPTQIYSIFTFHVFLLFSWRFSCECVSFSSSLSAFGSRNSHLTGFAGSDGWSVCRLNGWTDYRPGCMSLGLGLL